MDSIQIHVEVYVNIEDFLTEKYTKCSNKFHWTRKVENKSYFLI